MVESLTLKAIATASIAFSTSQSDALAQGNDDPTRWTLEVWQEELHAASPEEIEPVFSYCPVLVEAEYDVVEETLGVGATRGMVIGCALLRDDLLIDGHTVEPSVGSTPAS